jgi:hypothetical protein
VIATCKVLLVGLAISGCCKKQQCKPRTPLPPLEEIARYELPPGPGPLPVPERTVEQCPDAFVCYTIENAAKLAGRDQILKQWIRETKARHERALTTPDAGGAPTD